MPDEYKKFNIKGTKKKFKKEKDLYSNKAGADKAAKAFKRSGYYARVLPSKEGHTVWYRKK